MDTDIYILDFNDSFTFNIFSSLKLINSNLRVEVIPFAQIPKLLKKISTIEYRCGLILGPGPGHPDEYKFIDEYLEKILKNQNIFTLGICLGHQLLLSYLNYNVICANNPLHGQAVKYYLDSEMALAIGCPREIAVQRYNSLAVSTNGNKDMNKRGLRLFSLDEEIIISSGERLVTYQFHPESIGTTCPKKFFLRLVNFLI